MCSQAGSKLTQAIATYDRLHCTHTHTAQTRKQTKPDDVGKVDGRETFYRFGFKNDTLEQSSCIRIVQGVSANVAAGNVGHLPDRIYEPHAEMAY